MKKLKVTILGAGITGVSLGSYLADKDHKVEVLEKMPGVGGMAKSFAYKGNILDFGPHKIYSQIPGIIPEYFKIAGSNNMLKIKKKNSLFLFGKHFDFPVSIPQIVLGISPVKSAKLGAGFMLTTASNMVSSRKPKTYEDYFVQGFGRPAYNILFRDIAWKVWGNPKTLSEELGRKRVPVPNVIDMLASSKGKDAEGKEISAEYFYYPKKGGIGFISEKYVENMKKNGGKLVTGATIQSINTSKGKVESVTYQVGKKKVTSKTDFLAGTIYLHDMISYMNPPAPKKVKDAVSGLKYRALILVYLIIDKPSVLKDNWVFFPEKKYVFSRVSEHNSFSRLNVEKGKSILTVEVPCEYTDDIYNSDENYVFRRVIDDLESTNILKEQDVKEFIIRKAGRIYPVYDINYRKNMGEILKYLDSFKNLITLGRQGLYNYNNTDHCIDMSLKAADYIDGTANGSPKKTLDDWRSARKYFDTYRIVD